MLWTCSKSFPKLRWLEDKNCPRNWSPHKISTPFTGLRRLENSFLPASGSAGVLLSATRNHGMPQSGRVLRNSSLQRYDELEIKMKLKLNRHDHFFAGDVVGEVLLLLITTFLGKKRCWIFYLVCFLATVTVPLSCGRLAWVRFTLFPCSWRPKTDTPRSSPALWVRKYGVWFQTCWGSSFFTQLCKDSSKPLEGSLYSYI